MIYPPVNVYIDIDVENPAFKYQFVICRQLWLFQMEVPTIYSNRLPQGDQPFTIHFPSTCQPFTIHYHPWNHDLPFHFHAKKHTMCISVVDNYSIEIY